MNPIPLRILLVYPEFPDTFWSFKHALKFVRKKAGAPPLGLLTVAAMLPPEWEKRLVDLNVTNLTEKDLKWADYVFVSAMVVQRESAHAVIQRCKSAGAKVVAGGPLFTMEYEQFPDVDYFVLNEAEATLAPFLEDLEQGQARRVYSSTEYPDIHQTPVPLWRLAKLKYYDTVSIQFSRGCPFSCDFCNVTAMLGHRPRTKTAVQIIAELDSLYAQGWRKSIFFVDDNFIGNKKQIKSEVLPALIEWRKGKSGMPFNTEASINLADDPVLLKLMTQAGFDTVFVGIETPNEDSLIECSKNQNKGRDLVESVKRLQRAGLQVQGGFIVGFDSDTPSIFQQQIDFIQKSGIVTAMVGLLQAPPGTRLHERLSAAKAAWLAKCQVTMWMARPTSSPRWAWSRCRKAIASCSARSTLPNSIMSALGLFCVSTIRQRSASTWIRNTSWLSGVRSTNWVSAASSASTIGGSFSGPSSGARACSPWRSHWPSWVSISARWLLSMSVDFTDPHYNRANFIAMLHPLYHQHRAAGMVQHLQALASQQNAAQRPMPARSHHDQVDRAGFCNPQDRFGWPPFLHLALQPAWQLPRHPQRFL